MSSSSDWLRRQVDSAKQEFESWPDWKKQAMMEKTTKRQTGIVTNSKTAIPSVERKSSSVKK